MSEHPRDKAHGPARKRTRRDDEREIDRMALEGGRTEWQECTAPAAGDPLTDDELRGLNILGQSDPRGDGAIQGASDPNAGDVHAAPPVIVPPGTDRRNPPLIPDAGMGDGGISASGGVAGGA